MPFTRAPIWVKASARSTTSGSQAALSMTVVPLASTAAIIIFSVPVTVGLGKRNGGTLQSISVCLHIPLRQFQSGRQVLASPSDED